jgi:hypothetical protein
MEQESSSMIKELLKMAYASKDQIPELAEGIATTLGETVDKIMPHIEKYQLEILIPYRKKVFKEYMDNGFTRKEALYFMQKDAASISEAMKAANKK